MSKKPSALESLQAVQHELTRIYIETQTPLMPTPLTQHLADAIYATMMATVEVMHPDQELRLKLKRRNDDTLPLIEKVSPPPIAGSLPPLKKASG